MAEREKAIAAAAQSLASCNGTRGRQERTGSYGRPTATKDRESLCGLQHAKEPSRAEAEKATTLREVLAIGRRHAHGR
jgi:hypothetical protein